MNEDSVKKAKGRVMGIDFGSKRVGVAISDEACKFAIPSSVILNTQDLVAEIAKIAVDNEIKTIILGESRNYAGEPNEIMLDSIEFKEKMEKLGFEIIFEPEFMTSVQAERIQGKTNMSDASAAALILQSYLDKTILNS